MRDGTSISSPHRLIVRAMRSLQAGTEIFAFFLPGHRLTEIADISRIRRGDNGQLDGFQRKEIREHIREIVNYLDRGEVLFPNAIILAVNNDFEFKQARGRDPSGVLDVGQIGTLIIPLRKEGQRSAWIVDGQQRAIALADSRNRDIPVPVVAFVAPQLAVQREQFILVNKARPLPTRLINELLPEVDVHLPRDLAARKIPSELCRLLNKDPRSPFYHRIKQPSEETTESAVISDTAVIEVLRRSVNEPLGALAAYRGLANDPVDTTGMYRVLLLFWGGVADVFHDAWGLPPTQSRLTHSAGVKAMGVLMDRLLDRYSTRSDPAKAIRNALSRMATHCRWTNGAWEDIGMAWNDIQNVPRHVRMLTDQLLRIDAAVNLRSQE
jgi:DGQHR domain-containing protein